MGWPLLTTSPALAGTATILPGMGARRPPSEAEAPTPVALGRQSANSIASPPSNSTVLSLVSKDLMKSSPTQIPDWRSSGDTPPGATRSTVLDAVTSYQLAWPFRRSIREAV